MQRSINQGLVRVTGGFSVTPSCPSGNCNFSDFDTLGFCASYTDVSSLVIITNETKVENITMPPENDPSYQGFLPAHYGRYRQVSKDAYTASVQYFNVLYRLLTSSHDGEVPWVGPRHRIPRYGPLSLLMEPPKCLGYSCDLTSPTFLKVRGDGARFDVLTGFLRDPPSGYLPYVARSSDTRPPSSTILALKDYHNIKCEKSGNAL